MRRAAIMTLVNDRLINVRGGYVAARELANRAADFVTGKTVEALIKRGVIVVAYNNGRAGYRRMVRLTDVGKRLARNALIEEME